MRISDWSSDVCSSDLAAFAMPKMDLIGPTVADDIRRAIARCGADAVKVAVKNATKAKRGRKKEADWPELRELMEADASEGLAGKDPFDPRSRSAERRVGKQHVRTLRARWCAYHKK